MHFFSQNTFITETIRPKCCVKTETATCTCLSEATCLRCGHISVNLRETHGQRFAKHVMAKFQEGVCICKDFLHVGFNLSPEIQTFRSLRWIWEERGTEKEIASEHAHSVCGGRFYFHNLHWFILWNFNISLCNCNALILVELVHSHSHKCTAMVLIIGIISFGVSVFGLGFLFFGFWFRPRIFISVYP